MHGCLKFSSIDAVRLEIFCKEISTEKREQAHLPIICFPIFSLSAKESYEKRSIGQTSPALRGDHQKKSSMLPFNHVNCGCAFEGGEYRID